MMKDIVREIEAHVKRNWLRQPEDIECMKKRKGPKGQNLSIYIYVQGDTNSTAYFLYMLYSKAKERKGDLETLKSIAGELLSFQGLRFKDYYHMPDSEMLSMRAAVAVKDAETYEDFAEIVIAIQRYYGQLSYWVDLTIAWSELGKEHQKIENRLKEAK
jgi:hypothetical protein